MRPERAEQLLYHGIDPRETPRYTLAQAARYLHLSPATLRSWVRGRSYPLQKGTGQFKPLIEAPGARLSFSNLVEAHVLRALRAEHRVAMAAVREALDYAQRELGIERLLRSDEIRATPGNVFLERYDQLVNLGRSGQLAIRQLLSAHLQRIERDLQGLPVRLYPAPALGIETPRVIVIDPRISFGAPVVRSRAIRTSVLADRIDAGESIHEVAADYDLETSEVEAAILYERAAA